MNPEIEIGKTVTCQKCGKQGKLVYHTVRVAGKEYTYLAVQHDTVYAGKKSTKKCIIRLVSVKPAVKQEAVKTSVKTEAPIEAFAILPEYEKLKQENERLREENERLRQENEQLRMAIQNVYNARIVQAREKEREALRLKFVAKRGGLSPEINQLANTIMHSLVETDWVAIRLSDFENTLRGIGLWQ
jgi:regulator of replication initiation timing